jgi:hypothetical protein
MATEEKPLPDPGSPELREVAANQENALIYEFLFARRDDPPTMAEVREYVAEELGQANEQTDRRLRELRTHFMTPAEFRRRLREAGDEDPP